MLSLAILFSAVLILSCGQNHRQTDRQTDRITEADQRYTHATTVGVSKYGKSKYFRTMATHPFTHLLTVPPPARNIFVFRLYLVFTNFHAIRSWSFRNICYEIGWPRFFCATLYILHTLVTEVVTVHYCNNSYF